MSFILCSCESWRRQWMSLGDERHAEYNWGKPQLWQDWPPELVEQIMYECFPWVKFWLWVKNTVGVGGGGMAAIKPQQKVNVWTARFPGIKSEEDACLGMVQNTVRRTPTLQDFWNPKKNIHKRKSQIRLNAKNAELVFDRTIYRDSLSFYFSLHCPFSPKGLQWDYRKEIVKTRTNKKLAMLIL